MDDGPSYDDNDADSGNVDNAIGMHQQQWQEPKKRSKTKREKQMAYEACVRDLCQQRVASTATLVSHKKQE